MSAQFGRWNFDDLPPASDYLEKVRKVLAPYGPDGSSSYSKGGVEILYYAFHTSKESHQETQPYALKSGAVITWDGRLDNRAEFIGLLRDCLSPDSADVAIVAASYERWGTDCFARLIGDWALSIWNTNERSLILAKDPIGTRHLFYSADADRLTWSTVLDPLVLFAGKTFALEEEYIAGWLGMFPAAHLTPYVGIHSVPPSCFVRLEQERKTLTKYWDFDPTNRIRYCSDAEYEEHFRNVFAESVQRRLRSDAPILAELSGGMDSSSIVCMADTVIARGTAVTPRLDTVSYYNDSEPNWNERPYFTKVEEMRGRTGCHIDVGSRDTFEFELDRERFAAAPGSGGRPNKAFRQFAACMTSVGSRVLLSGIGGDEIAGGVPTPTPELQDLLARAHFGALAHQLKVWALSKRTPWFRQLFEAILGFFPPALVDVPKYKRPAPWLSPGFVKRNGMALRGYEGRVRLFGPLPSFQENVSTIDALRRQLGCDVLPSNPPHEKRYPYLDRDFLEFICAIPREQLVRPGERRSLMRRALVGIVPDELLNRSRKAFVVRTPLAALTSESPSLREMRSHMVSASLCFVESHAFWVALRDAGNGQEVSIVQLLRTLALETWLTNLAHRGLLRNPEQQTNVTSSESLGAAANDCPAIRNISQLRTIPQ
jgi:asparagine synthase (glutamine-hydrolysing)